jgi:hypothetical protein
MDGQLASQRCLNHWQREAVARCPECKRFFCRECITEHEDRILCASCIKSLKADASKGVPAALFLRAAQLLVSFLIAWIVFYYIGKALLLMPDEFHEGTVWEEGS